MASFFKGLSSALANAAAGYADPGFAAKKKLRQDEIERLHQLDLDKMAKDKELSHRFDLDRITKDKELSHQLDTELMTKAKELSHRLDLDRMTKDKELGRADYKLSHRLGIERMAKDKELSRTDYELRQAMDDKRLLTALTGIMGDKAPTMLQRAIASGGLKDVASTSRLMGSIPMQEKLGEIAAQAEDAGLRAGVSSALRSIGQNEDATAVGLDFAKTEAEKQEALARNRIARSAGVNAERAALLEGEKLSNELNSLADVEDLKRLRRRLDKATVEGDITLTPSRIKAEGSQLKTARQLGRVRGRILRGQDAGLTEGQRILGGALTQGYPTSVITARTDGAVNTDEPVDPETVRKAFGVRARDNAAKAGEAGANPPDTGNPANVPTSATPRRRSLINPLNSYSAVGVY